MISFFYYVTISIQENSFKFTERPWEGKWRLLSPIPTWQKSKKKKLNKSRIKPKIWKRYIDNVFSLWDVNRQDIDLFIEQGNTLHATIKFTADISEKEIRFLDTVVYKSERFLKEAILQKRKIKSLKDLLVRAKL